MNIILAPRWASSSLQLADNAYVDCGTASELSNINSFTLEAWVNPANLSGFQSIVGNVDNAIGGQYQLYLSDGVVVAYVGIAPYLIMSPEPITVNTWHHLASTYDGDTKTLTLYVDGNQVAQAVFSGTLPRNGTNTLLGAVMQQNAPTWNFQGQIGRVMIWNSARDTEDILNDSVQVNIYKATENTDLIFQSDFSIMPSVDNSGNNIPLIYHDTQYLFNVPSVVLGASGYVDCGSHPDYSIPGNLPYSIEGWFFPTSSTNGTLISYGKDDEWEYQILYENNQIIGRRNSDTLQIVTNSTIVPNSYYHFALTYDAAVNALSLYVNGNLQVVDYFPSPVTAVANGSILIGAQTNASNTPGTFLDGAIQNLRIWNVCLEQSQIFQWMYNDVLTDNRLISNYDFTVNPPVDMIDNAELSLHGGAVQTLQSVNIPMTEPVATLGLPHSINAIYLNQTPEAPLPPETTAPSQFAQQPELFSEAYKEKSWEDFVQHFGVAAQEDKKTHLRTQFESGYLKAQEMMKANPKLAKVFTRTDEKGMTRIIHHGIRGDTLVYEGAIGAESDCTIWWITFVFQLTVGFYQALGLLPTTGNIATRMYNLIRANPTAWNALTSLAGKTITATSAIGFMGVVYQEGLMWTIIKFVLTSSGWYALFWILKKVIAIVTGLEAAALLSGFVVWAAQLTILSLKYSSQCNQQQITQQPAYA